MVNINHQKERKVDQIIPALPDYKHCLVNLANSVLKKYGVPTTVDTLPLADRYLGKSYKNVLFSDKFKVLTCNLNS